MSLLGQGVASLVTVEWRSLVDRDVADDAVFGILKEPIAKHLNPEADCDIRLTKSGRNMNLR